MVTARLSIASYRALETCRGMHTNVYRGAENPLVIDSIAICSIIHYQRLQHGCAMSSHRCTYGRTDQSSVDLSCYDRILVFLDVQSERAAWPNFFTDSRFSALMGGWNSSAITKDSIHSWHRRSLRSWVRKRSLHDLSVSPLQS